MNKKTSEKYERLGSIFSQLSMMRKLSTLERLLIDELSHQSSFQRSIELLRLLKFSEDALSLVEISEKLNINEETATVMIRSLKTGGFEFSEELIPNGPGRYLVFDWNPKESMLTYILDIF